jgi:hypothetical protein
MTHKIINNISIKIHDKKTGKKRKSKKKHVRHNQNGIYNNAAIGIIQNKSQVPNLSSLVSRENDDLVNNTITALKRNNEILLLKDKVEESPPKKVTRKTIKDKTPDSSDGYISYSQYPNRGNFTKIPDEDRVEFLGDINKRGRPVAPQKANETNDMYYDRIKKTKGFKESQLPMPTPRNRVQPKSIVQPPMVFSPSPIKTRKQRADEKQEEINNNVKMNQRESFL